MEPPLAGLEALAAALALVAWQQQRRVSKDLELLEYCGLNTVLAVGLAVGFACRICAG